MPHHFGMGHGSCVDSPLFPLVCKKPHQRIEVKIASHPQVTLKLQEPPQRESGLSLYGSESRGLVFPFCFDDEKRVQHPCSWERTINDISRARRNVAAASIGHFHPHHPVRTHWDRKFAQAVTEIMRDFLIRHRLEDRTVTFLFVAVWNVNNTTTLARSSMSYLSGRTLPSNALSRDRLLKEQTQSRRRVRFSCTFSFSSGVDGSA
jgi:hypothetical protein